MAESAVSFLLDKLSKLLTEEAKLLGNVRQEVSHIKDDMDAMRAFLRDADAKGNTREEVKVWVRQVRELAYDIEDILDEFMVRLGRRNGPGFIGARFIKHVKVRHQIATQIKEIRHRIGLLVVRRHAFAFRRFDEGTSSSPNVASLQKLQDPRLASHFLKEDEVVGIEDSIDELSKRLVKGAPQLTVIYVLGMGGLGKTTLVKKIYDKPEVQSYFKSCYAWITLSQSPDVEDLLRDMMKQFFDARKIPVPEGINSMKDVQLMKIINDYLREKRYVAVLDDVWKIEAWENIFKYVFPDCNNGSRIMVTTRMAEVTKFSCVDRHVHNLQSLNEEKAWALFCKKTFGLKHMGSCPPELKEISHQILKRCGGLPLAIVTIGGILSKKETELREWQKLHDNLSSEMEINPSLIGMMKILELSYNDLPYYLKSCLLYLSLFPEDYSIKRKRLIRFWIAEGFVNPKERSTVEEVASSYLIELMDRSLIQSATLRKWWQTLTDPLPCRISVHDLTRDIIVLKSKEENFSTFIGKNNKIFQEKIHRLSICESGESVTKAEGLLKTRCLILFRSKGGACDSLYADAFFSKFKLLRVLDLRGAPLVNFPSKIGELFHLRFLSLRRTNIKTVPKSIGKLKKLEVLDLKHTYITQLPQEILNLTNLRILSVYRYKLGGSFHSIQCVHLPSGIGNLISLEKLAYVDVGYDIEMVKAMGKLTHLKRLGIRNLKSIDGEIMCVSIEKMKELSTLDISSTDEEEILNIHSLACPQHLQHVYLRGRLEKIPGWITSQQSLVRVTLQWCKLRDDPLKALQALPNLVYLSLRTACYDGEELRCEEGTFPKLKVLALDEMDKLNMMTLGERAMGGLQYLVIKRCPEMKTLPLGIESLTDLKELNLWNMSDELVEGLRKDEGSDHWKIKHIPLVRRVYDKNGQTYGENLV